MSRPKVANNAADEATKYTLYIVRRPKTLARGIVKSVPIRPPRLKALVAVLIQSCLSAAVAAGSSARVRASAPARVLATAWMNTLQLHQVMSAVKVTIRALRVSGNISGVNISRIRAGAAVAATDFQRSGSLTKMRTRKAAAAGSRPNKST